MNETLTSACERLIEKTDIWETAYGDVAVIPLGVWEDMQNALDRAHQEIDDAADPRILTDEDRELFDRAVAVMNAAEELREAESAEHPNPTEANRIFEAQMELMNTTDAIQPADTARLTALATGGEQ